MKIHYDLITDVKHVSGPSLCFFQSLRIVVSLGRAVAVRGLGVRTNLRPVFSRPLTPFHRCVGTKRPPAGAPLQASPVRLRPGEAERFLMD